MSEGKQYKRTTKNTLEGEVLIEIRKYHVSQIARELVIQNIVSKQYLDNLIKIKTLKNNTINANANANTETVEIVYNDEKRIELLESLLQKECTKGTAKLINELCQHK
jgi:hypothetical protein